MENNNKPSQLAVFESYLERYTDRITKLLSNKYGISKDEFVQSTFNAVRNNPKLLNCDPKSLFGSILTCAELGLKFNTPLGHCYIIPYGTEATLQIGYKGLIQIMYRNPKLKIIDADIIYANDTYEITKGTNAQLIHKPCMIGDRGNIVAAYAIAKMENSDPIFTYVTMDVLQKIEKISKSSGSSSSPYKNGTDVHDSMRMKAAVKKIAKLLPTNDMMDLMRAIDIDDKVMSGGKLLVNEQGEVVVKDKPNATVDTSKYSAQFDEAEYTETKDEPVQTPTSSNMDADRTTKKGTKLF